MAHLYSAPLLLSIWLLTVLAPPGAQAQVGRGAPQESDRAVTEVSADSVCDPGQGGHAARGQRRGNNQRRRS